MRDNGDAYYEAAKLMDLKIQGTLGLNQRDVKAVSDIDGVELAEGSYSTDVMSGEDDARKVLHLESISDVIAFPKIKDASCLMTEAPTPASEKQLEELSLAVEAQEETVEE